MALPGSGKSVEQYQADVGACQQYANAIIAANSGTAAGADNSAAASAASAAVFGAAMGALIGSATGQAGEGAAIGATTGLLFGGAAGSSYTAMSSYQLQRGYDGAYLQCMYSRGNRVPQSQGYGARPSRPSYLGPNAAPGSYQAPANASPPSYPPPANVPPSSYPPPDAPPPSGLPPRN
jgi:Glycine-zipper domain